MKSPSEARLSLPTSTQRKSGKPTFRLWPRSRRKEVHFLFSTFLSCSHKQGDRREGRDTLIPETHQVQTVSKFRRKRTSLLTQKDMSFPSFPFCYTRHAQNPKQPRLLSTSFPGTTSPEPRGSSMLPSPPPSLEGRGRLCHRIHVAR